MILEDNVGVVPRVAKGWRGSAVSEVDVVWSHDEESQRLGGVIVQVRDQLGDFDGGDVDEKNASPAERCGEPPPAWRHHERSGLLQKLLRCENIATVQTL